MSGPASEDLRLSLFDHLRELRTRLFKCTLAILILGGLSLSFSRELFHLLVVPILNALPDGQRALVQTSAVEELNTFLKVGMYAGLFFSAPVILWQLWGFVSPGLYANERRMAVPFVLAGTLCFVLGVSFCYFAILPPAFQFLLQPEEIRASQTTLELARGSVDDAGRLIRIGDLNRATTLLEGADAQLQSLPAGDAATAPAVLRRVQDLEPLLDAATAVASGPDAKDALASAILARNEARADALQGTDGAPALEKAERELRRAYSLGVGGTDGAKAELLLERHLAASTRVAGAAERIAADDWTRPMLSMKEQLNLVLILLIAFGLIFEIPVVFSLLAALGIITGEGLARFRRYAIVVNVIVAAVVTPTGDPLNLALMAVPMILCYEIGIIAAKVITARRKAREAAALAA